MTQQTGGVDPDDDVVVVIDGGPAGLTAATWLRHHRRSALAFDGEQYLKRWVEKVRGVLASDPVSPQALVQQAKESGALRQRPPHSGTVTAVTRVGSAGSGSSLMMPPISC
jgi:thioredoxin reductase